MTTIEVDFEVFKELTARRASEAVTYNDVIREALGLRRKGPTDVTPSGAGGGCMFKGVSFPEGTQFRATYKGIEHRAQIKGRRWIAQDGTPQSSPSAAAVRITGKNWNGWRFWYAKRPGDTEWQLIENLRVLSVADLAV